MPTEKQILVLVNLKEVLGEENYRKFHASAEELGISDTELLWKIAFGIPPLPLTPPVKP